MFSQITIVEDVHGNYHKINLNNVMSVFHNWGCAHILYFYPKDEYDDNNPIYIDEREYRRLCEIRKL